MGLVEDLNQFNSTMAPTTASILSGMQAEKINQQNIGFQTSTNEANEGLMRESWARDDTAVQRRAKDLIAAGFNPVLAAGSAASNSGPISLRSPEVTRNPWQEGAVTYNAMKQGQAIDAQISHTRAQTAVSEEQAKGLSLENKLKGGTVDANIGAKLAEAKITMETVSEKIAQSKAEAERAYQEAESASSYYYSRAQAAGSDMHIKAADATIAQLKSGGYLNAGKDIPGGYFGAQYKAELTEKQMQAMIYAAAAGVKTMDADLIKRLGIPPVAVKTAAAVFDRVLAVLKAFMK